MNKHTQNFGRVMRVADAESTAEKLTEGFEEPGTPRQLTQQEANHVAMHKLLVGIQCSAGWENLDPHTQDEINAAVREAKQWFGRL